jgi:hypothetical protein
VSTLRAEGPHFFLWWNTYRLESYQIYQLILEYRFFQSYV